MCGCWITWSEQREDLALVNVETGAVEGHDASVPLTQVLNAERRIG